MARVEKVRGLFRHPDIGAFFQAQPRLENPFTGDAFLQRLLRRVLPVEAYHEVENDLSRFGERARYEMEPLSDICEQNPPYLVQMDPWGKRVDNVVTCDAWKKMKVISAEEGVIAIGYERKLAQWSRLHQFAKLYMYMPSSGLYSCPVAMTDGAAKSIEAMNIKCMEEPYRRLISRNPNEFWTSGQWMTERRGGSDVGSGTETIAVPQPNGKFALHGYKWFSSATDSDMSLTLGRIATSDGETQKGSAGLSMFFVKTRRDDGTLNNIQVMRLKNKLGTRQLPTGELLMDGTEAELVSDPGRGVASISQMLTITRIHNAVASVSAMRRILSLSRDYATRRKAFGVEIAKYPLHINTLAAMELEVRGGLSLAVETVRLLGATECGKVEDEDHLLRLLTPVAKLYTGKRCIPLISEGLESFGGQGYIEDTGLPRILRDAQVTPIWEGTTNILSLDVLRAIGKSKGEVMFAFGRSMTRRLKEAGLKRPQLEPEIKKISTELEEFLGMLQRPGVIREEMARHIAFSIGETAIATLLMEHAASDVANQSDIVTAQRWARNLPRFKDKLTMQEVDTNEASHGLVYDGYVHEP